MTIRQVAQALLDELYEYESGHYTYTRSVYSVDNREAKIKRCESRLERLKKQLDRLESICLLKMREFDMTLREYLRKYYSRSQAKFERLIEQGMTEKEAFDMLIEKAQYLEPVRVTFMWYDSARYLFIKDGERLWRMYITENVRRSYSSTIYQLRRKIQDTEAQIKIYYNQEQEAERILKSLTPPVKREVPESKDLQIKLIQALWKPTLKKCIVPTRTYHIGWDLQEYTLICSDGIVSVIRPCLPKCKRIDILNCL